MNSKGFTLIELIAVIAITAIISLMSLPSLANVITNNSTRVCDNYAKSMIVASKSYIQKEGRDIKERYGGTFPSSYTLHLESELINGGYIEPFADSRTKINSNDAIVLVTLESGNTYTYKVYMKCMKSTGGDELIKEYK